MKTWSLAILAVILLVTAAAPGACASTSNSCSADFTGIRIFEFEVQDSLHASCSTRPVAWIATVKMYYRAGSHPYAALSGRGPVVTIPSRIGLYINLSVVCIVGWFQAQAEITEVDKPGDARVTTNISGNELRVASSAQCHQNK